MYKLVDFQSRNEVTPNNLVFTGAGGPWEVVMDIAAARARINDDYFRVSPPLVSKYLPLLPVKNHQNFVSLKEGGTPLIKSKRLGERLGLDLWFKLEPQNPTGSFKDRGSAMDLTVAKELGAKAIVLASTGNMAASCACYAAAAGMPCFVFVPEDTPASKLAQVIAYGGHIVQVKGTYNDAARMAQTVAEDLDFYLAGDYAFRVEGQKTAAFEICDQFFFQVPDAVVVPIGCGTNLAAYAKGFSEYLQLGFIDRLPRLIGVQASGACAVVNAHVNKSQVIEGIASVNTIASAIGIGTPLDGIKALRGIIDTNGAAVAVSDREMLEAQYELARHEGLFVEPSCASTVATLYKLEGQDDLAGKKVVCVLTGHGLKDPTPLLRVALKPPVIYPEVNQFLQLYNESFFEGRSVAFSDSSEIIFANDPSEKEVLVALKKLFQAELSPRRIAQIKESIQKFLRKGKSVTFSDFQDIVEGALKSLDKRNERELVVEDYRISTSKDEKPTAHVDIKIGTEAMSADANGVGPVDAVIKALMIAANGEKADAELRGYRVETRSEGIDAVVWVELKLVCGEVVALGNGISPDLIQASIEAFIDAYNKL